ncbi:hypothetical protein OV090_09915 [Nannocystis sp. RBIL2]|uniref:hypothetical protein n=1 Tax=Nannocystis sp. RBIL2 TaxID=2996788 RepID=UPI00226E9A44|nr:hypothetical protein [Nannocystis sp. RBIL2]MCY1065077.1 hypothetical protein [Nannocystis sp. RBIL2]
MQQTTREPAAPSIDETRTEEQRAAEDATPATRRLRLKTGIKAGDGEQAGNEHSS